MMGKSITCRGSISTLQSNSLRLFGVRRRRIKGKFARAAADALEHSGFRGPHTREAFERLGYAFARHDCDSVAIGDNDIPRGDRAASADDRQADRAGPSAAGRNGAHSHRVDRHIQRLERSEVTHEAVGHKADRPAIASDADDQIPGDRGAGRAAGGRDEDVAGLGPRDSRDEREIVACAAIASQRDAEQRMPDDRLDAPVERAGSAHGVDHKTRRSAAEALDELPWRPLDRWREGERGRLLDHDGLTDSRRGLRNGLRPNFSKPNQTRTKPNQENGLGLCRIPSSDSGLFNGLRAVQSKKTARTLRGSLPAQWAPRDEVRG